MEHKNQVYLAKAVASWQQSWDIYTDTEGWRKESGEDQTRGCVCSKKIQNLGKVFKLQAVLDASYEAVYEVLVPGVLTWSDWNPVIQGCQPVQTIDDNTDIVYTVGPPQLKGIIQSRDFVNLRHWKRREDGTMVASACSVSHPDVPISRLHVRAENKPSSFVFGPSPEDATKCQFACIVNMDVKGWIPQFVIDETMSGYLMQYLKHLKSHLHQIQQHETQPETQSEGDVH